jgi:Phosphoesterase family
MPASIRRVCGRPTRSRHRARVCSTRADARFADRVLGHECVFAEVIANCGAAPPAWITVLDRARHVALWNGPRAIEGRVRLSGTAVWEGVERQGLRRRNQRMGRAQPGQRPDPSQPATDRLPRVKHIVVLMMENHSFDNYLGTLGRGDRRLDERHSSKRRGGRHDDALDGPFGGKPRVERASKQGVVVVGCHGDGGRMIQSRSCGLEFNGRARPLLI